MTTTARPDWHATGAKEAACPHLLSCRMPTTVYEWLRMTRYRTRRRMHPVVLEALAAYRAEVEAGRIVLPRGNADRGATMVYNLRASDELYRWLRVTATDGHTSINAVIVAALTRAHVIQIEGAPPSDATALWTPPEHATAAGDGPRTYSIQCRVPPPVYEWLRVHRYQTHRSMTRSVWEAVAAYRVEVDTGRIVPERGVREGGESGDMVKLTLRLDDETYEWLRTTAFHARSSINALVVAALTRTHAAQTEGTPRP